MKKLVLSFLTVILIFCTVVAVNSTDIFFPDVAAAEIIESGTCGENVTWTLDEEGTLTVNGTGEFPDGFSYAVYENTYKIIIGSGITKILENTISDFYMVEEIAFEKDSQLKVIGEKAFYWMYNLSEIEIPASVTEIGDEAFYICENLESIVFEENSQLEIIGKKAFSATGITQIKIPASVKTIGEGAFYYCPKLIRAEFEKGSVLERLGEDIVYGDDYYHNGIFSHCDSLVEVILPESLTFIGTNTFRYSGNLKTVNLEDCHNLTAIGVLSFAECKNLIEITIPENVEYIDHCAFDFCYGLTKLIFAENAKIKYLEWGAFRGLGIEELEIPASMATIGAYAFEECSALKSVTFEKNCNLNEIAHDAFANTGITSIEIPGTVTKLGDGVFFNCKNLVSVSFEETSMLESIGYISEDFYKDGMFAECSSLVNVTLPKELKNLGGYTFYKCSSLEYINLENIKKLTCIGRDAFEYCENLKTIILPDNLQVIGERAFNHCEKLTNINIPENVAKIENYTFGGCLNLSEVTFAENCNVQTIGDSVFNSCIKLQNIQLPEKLTYIGNYAFEACTGISDIELPEKLEHVGDFAFIGTKIKEIHLPASVSFFGAVMGAIEKFSVDDDSMYFSTDENGILYNKDKTVLEQYPAGLNAKEFTIPDGVQSIGEFAFSACRILEKVVMPDSVTEIQAAGFAYAFSLKEIVMSPNIETIGESSFALCVLLEQLDIPATVTEVAENAFDLLFSLKKVRIFNTTLDFNDTFLGMCYFTYSSEEERLEICDVYIDLYYYYTCYDFEYINEKYGSEEALMERLGEIQDKVTDEMKTDAYTVYCYKGAAVEEYLIENNIKYAYICDHVEEEIPAVAPTCTKTGLTAGVKCAECGDVLVAQKTVSAKGHSEVVVGVVEPDIDAPGYTGDTICSECNKLLASGEEIPAIEVEETIECEHICHKDGFMGFIWKMINFFQTLFGINSVCECGSAHY